MSDPIVDVSGENHAITAHGDPVHSTAEVILGSSSLHFDGSGDYLTLSQTSDMNFNGDFTLETWVYVNSNPANMYGSSTDSHMIATCWHSNNNNENWQLLYNAANEIVFGTGQNGGSIRATAVLNTWHHVAVVGSGDNISLFLDGVKASGTISGHSSFNSNISKKIHIGTREMLHLNNRMYFSGAIQDFRISKVATYTCNFTPPSSLLVQCYT